MNERERKLRAERAKLAEEMRAVLDKADEEKRNDLTAEENESYNKMEERLEKLEKDIEQERKLAAVEDVLGRSASTDQVTNPDIQNQGPPKNSPEEIRSLVEQFTKGEMEIRTLADVQRTLTADGKLPDGFVRMQRDIFCRFLAEGEKAVTQDEIRALQMDADIYGGYVVMPQQMVQDLLKAVDDLTFIRQYATTYQVPKAESLGVPSLDNDPAAPAWTSEIGTGDEDSTMSFGKRELHPHPLAKRIKVSRKLLRSSFLNVEQLVRDRLAYKGGVTVENAYINGTGAQQPLGLMVASDDGIPTTRDISTDNLGTSITFDGLIEAKFALKSQYWPKARWGFHRDAVKQVRKLKDGNGQYIWRASVTEGEPDRILELPYFISEYMPNTFETSQYVGILGDFSFYWIADALDMEIQRLEELYAEANQIGLILRQETDGMPVLGEAFVRVKLAAA